MKRFQFSLESALQYRRLQGEREEAVLAELVREQEHWAFQEREMQESQSSSRRDALVLARDGQVTLETQDMYVRRLARLQQQVLLRQRDCQQRLNAQRLRVAEAKRNVKTLENLRYKARAEWRTAETRELEELASDSFLARWNRETMDALPEEPH